MPKYCPSQYDCDNMEPGDIIMLIHRGIFYRFIRKRFLQNKIKIRVRMDWGLHQDEYKVYYQEDCVLFYKYERYCTQKKSDVTGKVHKFITRSRQFDVSVDLDNLYIKDIVSSYMLSIPVAIVDDLIEKNKKALLHNNRQSLVKQALTYCRYDGNFFKKIVNKREIKSWCMMYCSICGKPMVAKFNDTNIEIEVACDCGNLESELDFITYDDFAITFNSQTSEYARKRYMDFWINNQDVGDIDAK